LSLLINRKYKWVFVHIPKTGGSSISHILNQVDGTESLQTHGSILEVKDNISDYFKFTIVRNPFTRFISEYFHQIRKKETNKNFEFYIKQVDTKGLHLIPQSYFVNTELDKTRELNFIGRYENYIDEVKNIFQILNINQPIPHRNRNPIYDLHPNLNQEKYYSAFYSEEWMVDLVRERYKDDFKIFNYELDLPR